MITDLHEIFFSSAVIDCDIYLGFYGSSSKETAYFKLMPTGVAL